MLLGYFAPIDALLPVALPQDELTRSQLSCLAAALKGMTSLGEPHLLTVCQALAKSNNTNMEVRDSELITKNLILINHMQILISWNTNAPCCTAPPRL